MKKEFFLSKIDKSFIIEFFSQKHQEFITKYQILTTTIFTISTGFAIAYATSQMQTANRLNMIVFSLSYGILGFFGLTLIFQNYFKSLKNQLLSIGDSIDR